MSRRMSLTKNSLGVIPVKKVSYYISKSVMDKYNKTVELLGKEYEEKNFKPNVTYKLPGSAYINKKLEIHIINSEPTSVWFNGEQLGVCSGKSTGKEEEVLWRQHHPDVDDKYRDYTIKTCLVTDGFLSGRTWEAFDSQGSLIKDMTDYNKWS